MSPAPAESNPDAEPAPPPKRRPKETLWGDPMNTDRWDDWGPGTLEITKRSPRRRQDENVLEENEEQ
jgi:hypothetical protein